MHKALRRTAAVIAIGLTFVAASGVAVVRADAPAAWKHGIVAAKSDAGFVFMSANHGFATKQGIALDMEQFQGDGIALKALLAGDVDSYDGNPGGPMIAAAHGADIKLVGCYWPTPTYGIFTKTSVKSPQELKNKTFAVSTPGALPDLLARVMLETYGMSADDVRFAALGSDSDRFHALVAGVADAAAISTEFVPEANANGLKLLVSAHQFAPRYLRFCTSMSAETIAKRRPEAVRYLAAQMKALRYALAHRDDELALTRQIIGAKSDDPRPAYIFAEVQKENAVDPTMPIPIDKLAWMQDLLIKTGNLPGPINFSTFVDNSVRLDALKLAAK
jgi:NitT/TauT family transport system substrate-binding protein